MAGHQSVMELMEGNCTSAAAFSSKYVLIIYSLPQAVGIIGASMWVQLGALKAAKDFHRSLLARMMRAPMSFFDTTPTGRILNRDL